MTRIFVYAVVSILLIASCSQNLSPSQFRDKLRDADATLYQTDADIHKESLIRSLTELSQQASSPTEVLSVVKRLQKLNAVGEIILCLDKALERFPEDTDLSACLLHFLIRDNRLETVANYGHILDAGKYSTIYAEAVLKKHLSDTKTPVPLAVWRIAYNATENQVFLQQLAIALAKTGKLSESLKLRRLISHQEENAFPYLWSILAFYAHDFKLIFTLLPESIAQGDAALATDTNPHAITNAQNHLLLAAQVAYTEGKNVYARSLWQEYADRFHQNPRVLYNLAVTAPTKAEKVAFLEQCLTIDKYFYPAFAQYLRDSATAIINTTKTTDKTTEMLLREGFYTVKMERNQLEQPVFNLNPQALIDTTLKKPHISPIFALEAFRFSTKIHPRQNAIGRLWELIEKYPDNALVADYARYFFLKKKDFNAFLALSAEPTQKHSYFATIMKALQPIDMQELLTDLAYAVNTETTRLAALKTQAWVYYKTGRKDEAIKSLNTALNSTKDKGQKSTVYYEIASILQEQNKTEQAIASLKQALLQNPENTLAYDKLQKLERLSNR